MIFTTSLFKRFLYLASEKELSELILTELSSKLFLCNSKNIVLNATNFHNYAYLLLDEYDCETRIIISLMLFNFVLVKGNIPTVHLNILIHTLV